jgi:hypothetical protein
VHHCDWDIGQGDLNESRLFDVLVNVLNHVF